MSRLGADGMGGGVGGQAPIGPVAYTPVVTWAGNTITTQSGFWLKSPGKLEVWVSFIETAGAVAAILTITTPTGYTAVTHTGSLAVGVGTIGFGATSYAMSAAAGALTQVSSVSVVAGITTTLTGYFSIATLT